MKLVLGGLIPLALGTVILPGGCGRGDAGERAGATYEQAQFKGLQQIGDANKYAPAKGGRSKARPPKS